LDGGDEREFLNDHFPDLRTLTTAIFRKGYEWPFDSGRVVGHGSSLIDVLVYRETVQRGRRVFLDFLHNPTDPAGREVFDPNSLNAEPRDYLRNSNALQETPIARLLSMNSPAVDLYRGHGIDLEKDRLEIAVCAQHNNGGLRANTWWESNVQHLFPVGEVCGTHGVRRPGGSALNAGQVGAIRAARFVAHNYRGHPLGVSEFCALVADQVKRSLDFCRRAASRRAEEQPGRLPNDVLAEIQDRMSRSAAFIREPTDVRKAKEAAWRLLSTIHEGLSVSGRQMLPLAFRVADLCLTHAVYLEAISAYLDAGGGSRGGVLVLDADGISCGAGLGDGWRFRPTDAHCDAARKILEVSLETPGEVTKQWVDVRPIPESGGWFERVWADFRTGDVLLPFEEE
jgi:hypothetical protein